MKLRAFLVPVVAVVLAAVAGAADSNRIDTALNPDVGDQEAMQGTWEVVTATIGGQKFLNDGPYRIIIKGAELLLMKNGKNEERTQIKLDPTRYPKTIDLHIGMGQEGVVGIYKMEGNTLSFCWTDLKDMRPRAFPTKPDEKVILLVLRRVRP